MTLLGDIMQELLMWKPEQSQIYLRYYLMAFLRGHILSVHLQQCRVWFHLSYMILH